MTTTHMARISLKMMMQSVLMAWTIWIVAVIALRLLFLLTGYAQPADPAIQVEWWYYPVTLVGPWITAGVAAAIGMSGRVTFFLKLFCALMCVWVITIVVTRFVLTEDEIVRLSVFLTTTCGVVFVAATVWVFVAALRRSLIEPFVAYLCSAIWLAGSILIAANWQPTSAVAISQLSFVVGALALAVAPFASAPLALHLNRHR